KRVKRRQQRLLAQLCADLRPDDFGIDDLEAGDAGILLQRVDDRVATCVERRLAGVTLGQGDDDGIVSRLTEGLDARVPDAGTIRSLANAIYRWRLVKLHIDQRSALEVDAERNAVPEEHR